MARETDLGPTEELEDDDVAEAEPDKSTELADEGDDDAGDDAGDDGDEGDHGDDDAAGEDEGQAGQKDQVGRRGRASDTIRTLKAERRADRERTARLERELEEIKRGQQQTQTRETQAERQQRLALMSDSERTEFLLAEQRNEFQNQLFGIRFENADRADKAEFKALCAAQPAASRFAGQVEDILAAERRAGRNPSRELIVTHLIGKRALERAGKAGGKQRKAADVERERQRGKPGVKSRSDVPRDRGASDDREARRKRLEGATF